jgi:hypothetical protein
VNACHQKESRIIYINTNKSVSKLHVLFIKQLTLERVYFSSKNRLIHLSYRIDHLHNQQILYSTKWLVISVDIKTSLTVPIAWGYNLFPRLDFLLQFLMTCEASKNLLVGIFINKKVAQIDNKSLACIRLPSWVLLPLAIYTTWCIPVHFHPFDIIIKFNWKKRKDFYLRVNNNLVRFRMSLRIWRENSRETSLNLFI